MPHSPNAVWAVNSDDIVGWSVGSELNVLVPSLKVAPNACSAHFAVGFATVSHHSPRHLPKNSILHCLDLSCHRIDRHQVCRY